MCYFHEGELEQNTRSIAANYVRSGWFFIDFSSSISSPLALVAEGIGIGRNMRILKLLKLTKLMRLARLKKLIESLGEMAADAKLAFGFFKLFVGVCAFAHIICCGWWAIGENMEIWYDSQGIEDGMTWYRNYYGLPDGTLPELSTSDKYWGSLYWSFISITTGIPIILTPVWFWC